MTRRAKVLMTFEYILELIDDDYDRNKEEIKSTTADLDYHDQLALFEWAYAHYQRFFTKEQVINSLFLHKINLQEVNTINYIRLPHVSEIINKVEELIENDNIRLESTQKEIAVYTEKLSPEEQKAFLNQYLHLYFFDYPPESMEDIDLIKVFSLNKIKGY